jgi:hypothetical protein
MSDQTVNPNPTPAQTGLTNPPSWIKAHEGLIFVIVLLVFAGWFLTKFLNHVADSDNQKFLLMQQQLNTQKEANSQLSAQVATALAQYKDVIDTLTKQNQVLSTSQSNRTTGLSTQQQTDATLPITDLQARWANLAGFQIAEIAATSAGSTLTQNASIKTVQTLEEVPVLTQNYADEQTKNNNLTDELSKGNVVIADQTKQIAGLNLTLTEADKTCKNEVAAVNAKARASRLKWFGAGVVTGVIGTLVAIFH